jgi:hypothetical protein
MGMNDIRIRNRFERSNRASKGHVITATMSWEEKPPSGAPHRVCEADRASTTNSTSKPHVNPRYRIIGTRAIADYRHVVSELDHCRGNSTNPSVIRDTGLDHHHDIHMPAFHPRGRPDQPNGSPESSCGDKARAVEAGEPRRYFAEDKLTIFRHWIGRKSVIEVDPHHNRP